MLDLGVAIPDRDPCRQSMTPHWLRTYLQRNTEASADSEQRQGEPVAVFSPPSPCRSKPGAPGRPAKLASAFRINRSRYLTERLGDPRRSPRPRSSPSRPVAHQIVADVHILDRCGELGRVVCELERLGECADRSEPRYLVVGHALVLRDDGGVEDGAFLGRFLERVFESLGDKPSPRL